MKCKNCGANYRTRELKCPYCGTENMIGKIWLIERDTVDQQYEEAQKTVGKGNMRYVANKVMNRIILVSTVLFFLCILLVILAAMGYSSYKKLYKNINKEKIESRMEEYYQNGEYGELYDYMTKYDLYSLENYIYSQAAFVGVDYEYYKTDMLSFLSTPDEDKASREYLFSNAFKFSIRTYTLDAGLYSEEVPENQELYDSCRLEIMSFWKGMLGMTDEEVDMILDEDFDFYGHEMDTLTAALMERRAWE